VKEKCVFNDFEIFENVRGCSLIVGDLTRSWCWKMAALRKPLFGRKKNYGNVFGFSFHGKCR